jgi:hypothetical protein
MKKINLLFAAILTASLAWAQPTQPAAPVSCNSSACTPPVSETCAGGGTNVVTNFQNATLRSGSPTSLPAVYTFYNVATVTGQQVNATVTVESSLNVNMNGSNFSVDDDAAVDQASASIASFFAPRITANSNLTNADRRGYVQFTIRFFTENGTAGQQYPADYTTPQLLLGLNYIHYDIDGISVGTGGWFRETGVVRDVVGSTINADASTELVSYTYADGGFNYKGFAGSVCERDGVSRCAQVTAAANYITAQSAITIRMGYDYNFTNSNFNSAPTRQYGSRFGCFEFPELATLPVRLLSFSGSMQQQSAKLSWTSIDEVDFLHYEVERSTDGKNFSHVGIVAATGGPGRKQQYEFLNDLSAQSGKAFFYRLKMMDRDGQYSLSQVVMIRKDDKPVVGVSISPNPVVSGSSAVVRMESDSRTTVAIKVMDMSGKVVARQINQVNEGVNAISINEISRLTPGLYSIQVINGTEVLTTKLSVIR